jgi:hypothetical protein
MRLGVIDMETRQHKPYKPRPYRRKSRCIRDHDLNDPRNIRIRGNGQRECILCKKWRDRDNYLLRVEKGLI